MAETDSNTPADSDVRALVEAVRPFAEAIANWTADWNLAENQFLRDSEEVAGLNLGIHLTLGHWRRLNSAFAHVTEPGEERS